MQYAIRIPANKSLELEIEDILFRPLGKALPEALGEPQEFSLSSGELVEGEAHELFAAARVYTGAAAGPK